MSTLSWILLVVLLAVIVGGVLWLRAIAKGFWK